MVYRLMPFQINDETMPIYTICADVLERISPENLERRFYAQFHRTLRAIPRIVAANPQINVIGFNFTLIVEEGFRQLFVDLFGRAPPTNFALDFFEFILNNNVHFMNLSSRYGRLLNLFTLNSTERFQIFQV